MLVELRNRVLNASQELSRLGLARGTSGNVSARDPDTGLIGVTPTGIPYDLLEIKDITIINQRGEIVSGEKQPSSETPMHIAVYEARPDVHGIVHTHSIYATVFSVLNREIPIVTVPLAPIGPIPVAPFRLPGSQELAREAVKLLSEDKKTILLQNHGVLCADQTVEEALNCAIYAEEGAQVAYLALLANGLNPIPEEYISIIKRGHKEGRAL